MMLSVILLYMLMILLSTLYVIRHLICSSNSNWLLNFNLICKISMLEKLNLFRLTDLITLRLLM